MLRLFEQQSLFCVVFKIFGGAFRLFFFVVELAATSSRVGLLTELWRSPILLEVNWQAEVRVLVLSENMSLDFVKAFKRAVAKLARVVQLLAKDLPNRNSVVLPSGMLEQVALGREGLAATILLAPKPRDLCRN